MADVVSLGAPSVSALLCTAAAIRLHMENADGTSSNVEFVIAGRSADDCNKAITAFTQWAGGALRDDAMRQVVIMQQSSVVIDDEL